MDDLTYKLGDDGVVLNADAALDVNGNVIPFVDITSISGFDNAPFRETDRDHEGADGGFADIFYETGRDIVLEGTVYAPTSTIAAFLDSLKANYAPTGLNSVPFYFKFPGQEDRYINVKSRGCRYDLDVALRLGQTSVQFQTYAEDPRFYTLEEIETDLTLTSSTTAGFAFPFSFNLSFGVTTVYNNGGVITNNGNRPTPAIIQIPGPITSPQIVNDTTGHALVFDITIASGDFLYVDLGTHEVLLNGQTNRRGTLHAPDWFMIDPGDNFLRFLAASATVVVASVTLHSAWR